MRLIGKYAVVDVMTEDNGVFLGIAPSNARKIPSWRLEPGDARIVAGFLIEAADQADGQSTRLELKVTPDGR